MWKYLTLLFAVMFLTMLIGGRDQGQVRQGLLLPPIHAPLDGPAPMADPAKLASGSRVADPAATLATFVPVAPPAPAVTAPAVVARAATAPDTPAVPEPEPVFSLANAGQDSTPAAPAPAAASPLRWVSANAINVREGPSTGHAVVGRLTRNESVTVVSEAADGWLRIRIEGDGVEGFVAARLLSATPPG